jgi:hypothetical protein
MLENDEKQIDDPNEDEQQESDPNSGRQGAA